MSVNIRHLDTQAKSFEEDFQRVLHSQAQTDAAIAQRVHAILEAVRARGDAALLEFTEQFDGFVVDSVRALEFSRQEMAEAFDEIDVAQRDALQIAAERIRSFHVRQLQACGQSWSYRDDDGTVLGQRVTALDRVGVYVPGGKASYPSSVLMNAVPAQVAGVSEIIMATPTPGGVRSKPLLAAAHIAGVTRAFTVGGAQAIAALAYGTQTIPKVDKITGPGNIYVASAKQQVFGVVGVDMIAGPTEILVLADGSVPPEWVAMDLFSQAEHDELAQCILLCPDADYIEQVRQAMERLLIDMPRKQVIQSALETHGAMIHTQTMQEACEISNRVAPEHLAIACSEPRRWEPLLHHAGAFFLGRFSSETLGDYCAGSNHVLPTSGTARFSSPLGVYDFQKRCNVLDVSETSANILGPIAAELARGEGLYAHARAAEMRLR